MLLRHKAQHPFSDDGSNHQVSNQQRDSEPLADRSSDQSGRQHNQQVDDKLINRQWIHVLALQSGRLAPRESTDDNAGGSQTSDDRKEPPNRIPIHACMLPSIAAVTTDAEASISKAVKRGPT